MANFLVTTGISYHLEELIKKADEKLILISPFLKINDKLKQVLEDKNRMKIDIRVIYGKNDLQPDENNWLKSMSHIRTSFCKDLHAKCYLNEKEAIITSMNLYEFSQVNNNEMGIHIVKDIDAELYRQVNEEVQRLIRISDDITVTVEKNKAKAEPFQSNHKEKIVQPEEIVNTSKYFSTTALSKEFGISSKELFNKFEKLKFIERIDEDWSLTQYGKNKGAQIKKGQYGDYIAWPESIISEII